MSEVLNSLNNNDVRLYYKLDPGEPGLLRSAKAETSTLQVTGQETRNLQRLRHQAVMAGKVVLSAGVTYSRGIEGMSPVVRAGHTRVVSVEDSKPLNVLPDLLSQPAYPDQPVVLPEIRYVPEETGRQKQLEKQLGGLQEDIRKLDFKKLLQHGEQVQDLPLHLDVSV